MKVALVHDDFIQRGGAESLFATIASLWPNAPIYTSLVNWHKLPKSIDPKRIKTSWMQKIPFASRFYKILLPLYPLAFESFDLDGFDLVISSTTRFAKSVITKPQTTHICYLNNVPRFLWDRESQESYLPGPLRFFSKPLLSWLKRWDKVAAARVDHFVANSQNVSFRIQKYYKRPSQVVYPFADLDFFKPAKINKWVLKNQNYYLIVSRLVRWKKIEIAIRAANLLKLNLFIVGEGPDKNRLENLAKKLQASVRFWGRVDAKTLRDLYQNSLGLIITQEEDFGIAAVEAQACATPVIAYAKGGQAEIVVVGKSGLTFKNQTASSIKDAILRSTHVKWSKPEIAKNARRFSKEAFTMGLKHLINDAIQKS